jgi:hypothetical protein
LLSQAVEEAARLQALLQSMGYEVSRHASSMIVLWRGRLAATLHVYPEECRLNIYQPWRSDPGVAEAQDRLLALLEKRCSRLQARAAPTG